MTKTEYAHALRKLRQPAPANSPFEGFRWRSIEQRQALAPCLACASRSRVAVHRCR